VLDLALALVWTPIGIASLVALAAAVAACLHLPRLAVPLLALAVVLAGAAYVSRIQADLGAARRERDEAKAEAERQGRLVAEEDAAVANQDFLQASRALTVVTTRHEVASAELARKTDRVEALQPKALAYDAMSASRGSDCLSDVAKDLRMLPCRLFERLDDMGWIMRRNRGGAMASDNRKGAWIGADLGLRKEYVEHASPTVPGPHGLVTRRQVMITAKGKARLEMLLAQGSLALRSSRG
jgi:hypothetical protein